MASAIGDLVVRLNAQTRQFDSAMAKSRMGMGRFAAAGAIAGMAAAGVTAAINTMTNAARRTIAGIRALGAAGLEFNAEMRASLAIMGDVSAETQKRMRDAAFQAARDTGQAASEMARSYYYLASAGMDAEQSIAALPQVARFAAAGNFDMATTTDLATDAQSALGLSSKNAAENLTNLTRVTDVLIGANTLANASAEQFSSALTNKAGAALRSLGKDVEEGVAVLAAFADQGVKDAEAGTQLSIVLRDLQTKAIQNGKAFEKARIAIYDSSGEMRHMADIIGDVENRLAGMSDMARKSELLGLGFSDKSVGALLTLLGTSDKIREYYNRLRDMGRMTERVATKQLGPFEKGWNALKVSMTEAGASLMQWAGPILGKAFTSFSRMAQAINNIVQSSAGFKKLGGAIATFVQNGVANIDVMFGSWEGFTGGIEYAFDMVRIKLMRIWEDTTYSIRSKMNELGSVWLSVTDMIIKAEELKMRILGKSIPGFDGIIAKLKELATSTVDEGAAKRQAKLDKEHRERVAQLKIQEYAAHGKWSQTMQTAPRLSGAANREQPGSMPTSSSGTGYGPKEFQNPWPKDMGWGPTINGQLAVWDQQIGGFVDRATANGTALWDEMARDSERQKFYERQDQLAMPGKYGPQQRQMPERDNTPYELAGAMLKGSREAYSVLVNPMRGQDTQAAQLNVSKMQLAELKRINQGVNARDEEVDI